VDMSLIRERMEESGIDVATLTRRYCEIRQAKGEKNATPVNRRNMIVKAISDEGNPTLETFMDIVSALDGEVLLQWKSTTLKKFGGTDND
jgi:DNA-binding phage protein